MATDIKTKYPSTSTTAITISLASLAAGSSGVYTSGRQGDFIDNSSNLDLDHLFSGKIRIGTSPTASRFINIYVIGALSVSSGTPTFPDTVGTTDAALTFTSANVMVGCVRQVAQLPVDSTSDRYYYFGPISIRSVFGAMPQAWVPYVAHDCGTGVTLHATGSNHVLQYQRVIAQGT